MYFFWIVFWTFIIFASILGLASWRLCPLNTRTRALDTNVELNQLQSSNLPQERRALNAVQLEKGSECHSTGRWLRVPFNLRRAPNAVQLYQLQSSNRPQGRKYDMQVDIHNAEAKEEENDDNDVGNSLDFVILKNFSQGEKNK
ncbi:uncharacterized protein LOC127864024 isoform X1 [Dreissena polymorpha]|uniref:uncharacterized protein LOC127864024 isoform X1 n=1 Tax=Dreissena polymorpha TaxID=45954 RepID=UPI002265236C|nr:uncharacterized protein LOC127864024 isoform X1 [Dreissena polymorpha]